MSKSQNLHLYIFSRDPYTFSVPEFVVSRRFHIFPQCHRCDAHFRRAGLDAHGTMRWLICGLLWIVFRTFILYSCQLGIPTLENHWSDGILTSNDVKASRAPAIAVDIRTFVGLH